MINAVYMIDAGQIIDDWRPMTHLLHLDSSFQGESSVSRRLTARAAQRWQATHPGGTITYRDLAVDPIPHLDTSTGMARLLPVEQRTPAQHTSFALSAQLIAEIKQAETVLLGLPLYNYGPPSTVKAWVDHLVAPGLSIGEDGTGLLADNDFIVIESRGGGYGSGTPRHGWDHAQAWLPHAVSHTGLQPKFITVELTMADTNPAMAQLKPLARNSLDQAITQIDRLWEAAENAA
jgi:FMN-dependent NADH-azoreductase